MNIYLAKKDKRQIIPLEVKRKLIKANDEGISVSEISRKFQIPRTTVSSILKRRKRYFPNISLNNINEKMSIIEEMERLLVLHIDSNIERGLPFNQDIISLIAVKIYEELKINCKFNDIEETFEPSPAWFSSFKKKYETFSGHELVFNNEDGENKIDEVSFINEFGLELKDIIEEEGYSCKQIFNVVATGIYWKKLPSKIFISPDECSQSLIDSNEKLTLLLAVNASGDCKLKPLVIYHEENPKPLENYSKSFLPVLWKTNPTSLLTQSIFEDWFAGYFTNTVKEYCRENDLPFKILLLLDDCPAYSTALSLLDSDIQVIFFSSKKLLNNPISNGVTKAFSCFYIKNILTKAIVAVERGETLLDFMKKFSILHCIKAIAEGWNEVKDETIIFAWNNICPYLYDLEENQAENFEKTLLFIVEMANRLAGTRRNIKSEDVVDFLKFHILTSEQQDRRNTQIISPMEHEDYVPNRISNESNLNNQVLMDAFQHLETAMQLFEKYDPNLERSCLVNDIIREAYGCYRELYRQQVKRNHLCKHSHKSKLNKSIMQSTNVEMNKDSNLSPNEVLQVKIEKITD